LETRQTTERFLERQGETGEREKSGRQKRKTIRGVVYPEKTWIGRRRGAAIKKRGENRETSERMDFGDLTKENRTRGRGEKKLNGKEKKRKGAPVKRLKTSSGKSAWNGELLQ